MERSLSTYVAYIERPDYPPYMEDEEYPRIREKYEKAKLSLSDTDGFGDGHEEEAVLTGGASTLIHRVADRKEM